MHLNPRRRMLLAVAAATTLPRAAGAQPAGRVFTVGTLSLAALDPARPDAWQPFVAALREFNYVEGRNLVLKRAYGGGKPERLADLAADLVRSRVDLIVTTGLTEARAAKQATSSIPIVMVFAPDPVGDGLVASLARPGGNVTGLTALVPGLRQKYVELLREVVPSASHFGVIASSWNLRPETLRELEAAAQVLGLRLSRLPVDGPEQFDAVLARARKEGVSGIIAIQDPLTQQHGRALAQALLKQRLPAIFWNRNYVDAGGLMTYSADLHDLYRRAAVYVDKIFRGAKPADLPVEQPTKFALVLNLKTAQALGLAIPYTVMIRATEVLE